MKTINVNLIGDASKYNKAPQTRIAPEGVDDKATTISFMALGVTAIIFAISFVTWLFAVHSSKNIQTELTELKTRHEVLKAEQSVSATNLKNIQEEKKILEIKGLVQKQIDKTLLPWHSILGEIGRAVPGGIKISRIARASSSKRSESKAITLNIDGESKGQANPLEQISFFVLNINENPSAVYLSNAVIKDITRTKDSNTYKFSMITELNIPNQDKN